MSALPFAQKRRPAEALRWGAAAVLVAALHAGAGWWLLHRDLLPTPAEAPPGVIIDLEPVAVPTAAPASPDLLALAGEAPAPAVSESAAARPAAPPVQEAEPPPVPPPPAETAAAGPPSDPPTQANAPPPKPDPPPPREVEPEAQPEAAAPQPVPPKLESPVPAEAVVPPERPGPKPPVPPKPKVAVARPKPRPAKPEAAKPEVAKPEVAKPEVATPNPRRLARDAARRQARAEARAQAREDARTAAAREGGGRAPEAAAPRPAASGAEVASWRGAVAAHLDAYKPASPSAAGGTVRVAFTVDRGGRVTSASVSGSSGDPSLDEAAVAMVRRASPVPAPPAELGGRVALAVPVRFH